MFFRKKFSNEPIFTICSEIFVHGGARLYPLGYKRASAWKSKL